MSEIFHQTKVVISKEITDALTATKEIISELKNYNFKDKIIILKVHGIILKGKISDINFNEIEAFAKKQGAFVILKNSSKLKSQETEIKFEIESEDIEEEIISKFQKENQGQFNPLITQLIHFLQLEKKEDERSQIFDDRLLSESRKILKM